MAILLSPFYLTKPSYNNATGKAIALVFFSLSSENYSLEKRKAYKCEGITIFKG